MADSIAKIGGFGFLETTWNSLHGWNWPKIYRFASAAAWGSKTPSHGRYGTTPQSDVMFDRALRMVGHDMKVSDYRDTGHVEYQIPPSWWFDN